MAASVFDPVPYKQSTGEQCQETAEAWDRWGPTLMAAAFFEDVPDDVLDPHGALEYLEAISAEIDRIKPRDRSRFALLMYEEAKRRPDHSEFILSLIPSEASWSDGE